MRHQPRSRLALALIGSFKLAWLLASIFLGSHSDCSRAEPIIGGQPVCAYLLERPGRVLAGRRLRNGPDAGWVSVAGQRIRPLSLRRCSLYPWQPPSGQQLPDKPYSLLVTRDGTLWIGTYAGLVSWNGAELTRYPEVGNVFVTSLLEDREGTVWAGCAGESGPAVRNPKRPRAMLRGGWRASAHSFGVWVRTAQALSGPAQSLGFGDGSPALPSDMRCRDRGSVI